MPGQIVDDSILGDNKEKTKLYWETRMRNASVEREANGHALNRNRSSNSTTSIIQKINAEIEELSRREKELKSTSKSVSEAPPTPGMTQNQRKYDEDDDVFSSSNGSSLDEFEHSESPRLESGFYSNLGEDELQERILGTVEAIKAAEAEILGRADEPANNQKTTSKSKNSFSQPAETLEVDIKNSASEAKPRLDSTTILHKPAESETRFRFEKETPIEKEIRLSREREEEYRRQRESVSSERFLSSPATPKVLASPTTPTLYLKSVEAEEKPDLKGRKIQHVMATERLRREMMEAEKREEELRTLRRSVSMSTLLKNDDVADVGGIPEPLQPEPSPVTLRLVLAEEKASMKDALAEISPAVAVAVEAEPGALVEVQVKSPTPSDSPSPSYGGTGFNKTGLNSFNSMQRYLLKSSVQLRIGNNFKVPPPVKKEEKTEPVVSVETEEVQPPRRKLIPATQKIQNELREMQEREKEYASRRVFHKSSPNLLQSLDHEDSEVNKVRSGQEPGTFTPKERRRSTLINQWEEIIQNGN